MTRMMGRTSLVTGASSGMGPSHAVRLAEEGTDIVALDAPGAEAEGIWPRRGG